MLSERINSLSWQVREKWMLTVCSVWGVKQLKVDQWRSWTDRQGKLSQLSWLLCLRPSAQCNTFLKAWSSRHGLGLKRPQDWDLRYWELSPDLKTPREFSLGLRRSRDLVLASSGFQTWCCSQEISRLGPGLKGSRDLVLGSRDCKPTLYVHKILYYTGTKATCIRNVW